MQRAFFAVKSAVCIIERDWGAAQNIALRYSLFLLKVLYALLNL